MLSQLCLYRLQSHSLGGLLAGTRMNVNHIEIHSIVQLMTNRPFLPNQMSILQPHIHTIDVHHHFFPPDRDKGIFNAQLGWRSPPEILLWTPEKSPQAMDAMNIDFAILSLPAISSGSIHEENRLLARKRNEFAAAVCSTYPRSSWIFRHSSVFGRCSRYVLLPYTFFGMP